MADKKDEIKRREKAEKRYDQKTKLQKQIVEEVSKRFNKHLTSRHAQEKIWYTNVAFYLGKQWLIWDERNQVFREDDRVPKYRVRLTSNKIYSNVKAKVSQLLKSRPRFEVIPNTSDQEDMLAAKVGEKLLRHIWRKLYMTEKTHELSTWIFTTGTAFLKYYWDSQCGQFIGMDEDTGNPLYEGEMKVEVVSPFEVIVDHTACSMEECDWAIHAKVRSLEWISNQFPESVGLINEDSKKDETHDYLKRLKNVSPLSLGSLSNNFNKHDEESALVLEYWHKPGRLYPKGLHVIVCNDCVLFEEPMVKQKGDLVEIPLIKFDETILPGRFWGISSVEQVIPLQKEYNKSISQVVESKNLTSRPKVLNPKGSGVASSAFTTEPGEVIEHRPGMAPMFMPLPQLPGYVFENIQRTAQDLDEIMAVNDISKGVRPEGTRSAQQLVFLAEQDASRIAPTIHIFEKQIAELGQRLLRLASVKYKEERTIKIVGKNNEHEIIGFKGVDLRDNFDVVVHVGSALDTSKAAKQGLIMQLIQYGFINPEKVSLSMLLNMIELGASDAFYDAHTKDAEYAKRENMLIIKGDTPFPEYFEDHETHIAVHNNFRKTLEYERLSDIQKEFLDVHIQEHIKQMQDQMAAEAGMMPEQGDQGQQAPQGMGPMMPGGNEF